VHAGSEPGKEFGGVSPLLDFSTTFAQPKPGQPVVFDYARCGNPTRLAFERALAAMEGGKYAFAHTSGMSAHITLLNLLQAGDHVLCVDDVYGGTQRYLRKILSPNTTIKVDFSCFLNITEFKKKLLPNTKLVWLETPTNPTLKIFDIKAIADACKGSGAIFVVDNTFATAINQNPLALGADVVVHSVTKYIGGHSDIIGGCSIMNSKELYDRLFFVMKSMGTGMSAFDSWLAHRSLKTMEVRFERAQSNAIAVAKAIEAHKNCVKIIYPGLKSHPQHEIYKRQMKGPGAMISFYVKGGIEQTTTFLTALKLFTLAESLGGVESLAEAPSVMTHGSVPAEQRRLLGIEDNFIRLSVGIETEKDLVADIVQALDKL
jgi:cystathionine gamma-lyase